MPSSPPNPFSWLLEKDRKRGWRTVRHYYLTLPNIERWTFPYWAESPSGVPIHVVTGRDDWPLACWMLASWFHFSRTNWKVCVHDDGTLPPEGEKMLKHCFPGVRVIYRDEADAVLSKALEGFPQCAMHRAVHPTALKVFDVPRLAGTDRFILLDSDLLFFGKPVQVINWADSGRNELWFLDNTTSTSPAVSPPDTSGPAPPSSGSGSSPIENRNTPVQRLSGSDLGPRIENPSWSHLDAGLCLGVADAMNPAICEELLCENPVMTEDGRLTTHRLFAACARAFGAVGLFACNSRRARAEREEVLAIRHYRGAARSEFFSEGLHRLAPIILRKSQRN